MRSNIIFITGPTASGKTAVALELARLVRGEIISCDSMQVYRDMPIINQRPPEEVLKEVPHHLVEIISPEEEYSVSRFIEDAKKCIEAVIAKGSRPIFSGGTGLYVKSLIDGIFSSPTKDEALREELREEAEKKGGEYLHERLKMVDPVAAAKLHPNDVRRIIRAI
ncbi:MAG: tRNA (adenosine(37)-N6)-dimethylallyltransferase MiaA, partial [Candidatus Omnitrophica bacterium]|nr:tRNA (adenosine(37)-N6)-dimethylallyltransferase MiaA [Candidatus Omnitrophota bacterium]